MKIRSKKYQSLFSLVEKNRSYPLDEAIDLVKRVSQTKFDARVEAHVNLGLDLTKPEHKIKVIVDSPTTKPKKEKILVFCSATQAEKLKVGQDLVIGDEQTLKEIEAGKVDFDKLIATPDWMSRLVSVAKILGPKGLMPNPKTKTLVDDPSIALKATSSKGQVEIKIEKEPIIHIAIGKVTEDNEKIKSSFQTLVKAIKVAKPEKMKRNYLKSIYLAPTMGPSVKLDLGSLET
ncbi:MAG: hypothetical protein A2Y57_01265 [Candidatus Woykebacteria bacterium RBG_13_40_7b]|uniref:Ribosomal protein n=1 Tax=Candidatus Woykebacteria bacterium RBG_13_40_7b TaxID=1802594 RepID=A0A1G1WA03_9BACT|nr:MAG: hypothetical protein A2Y57_01265 [Candidatus Woykebacteria bacterium RBG_13_40_7b]